MNSKCPNPIEEAKREALGNVAMQVVQSGGQFATNTTAAGTLIEDNASGTNYQNLLNTKKFSSFHNFYFWFS